MRTEARASILFPDYPEYETPNLSYENRPSLFIQVITGRSMPYLNKRNRLGISIPTCICWVDSLKD